MVGVQIENESRGPWDYLESLKNIAVKAGFESPSIHVPVGLHFGEKRFSGNCCLFMVTMPTDSGTGNWRICRAVMPMLSL